MYLTHLNHSSIICESDTQLLLTDPWVFSNAFQGWHQYPYPHLRTVNKILPSSEKLSIVLLSHAHDDHVDNIFLSHLTKEIKVIIPKTSNPGFRNRVLNSGVDNESIIEVDEEGVNVSGYNIASFFDGLLSKEDFIFTISSGDSTFVHANDNWREFKKITRDKIIGKISSSHSRNVVLMSQVGVADSYPLFYRGISSSKKKDLIASKIEYMCKSLISNTLNLGLGKAYAYANQSKFINASFIQELDFDPYLLRDEIINKHSKYIKQLNPSDQIKDGKYFKADNDLESIMNARLKQMQLLFSEYAKSKDINILPVKFKLIDDFGIQPEVITLYASDNVWNDILNGSSNLESIITGGMGLIDKPDYYNMKEEYLLLSSWAYINQITAKKDLNLPSI